MLRQRLPSEVVLSVSRSVSRKEMTSLIEKSGLCFVLVVVTLQSNLYIQKINQLTFNLVNVISFRAHPG